MIEQGLKFLADLANKAKTPQKLELNKSRFTHYIVDGEQQSFSPVIEPREHDVNSLDEIIALANRFKDDADSVVWYDHTMISLILDDSGLRISRADLILQWSDVFLRTMQLRKNPQTHTPRQFVRLLRIELAGTLQPAQLLNSVKTIKFDNGVVNKTEIARGRESLSSEVKSRVEPASEIPEEVTLELPVYKTMGLRDRYPLRCSVEVDPAEGTLQLLPLPDEIERVQHLAIASISGHLAAGLDPKIPSYFGTP